MKINSIHSIVDVIASQYTIPLPLNKIAEEEGLRVIYDDYGRNTFDGMTWYEPDQDQFFIHINIARGNRENSSKARFTLAHELGHYFIDHHRHQSDAHATDSWNIFRFYLEHHGFDLVFNKSTRSNFAPYFYSLYEVSWVLKLVMYHF